MSDINNSPQDLALEAALIALGHNVDLRVGCTIIRRGRRSFIITRPDGSTRIMRVGHRLGECRNWQSAAEWIVNELHWWGWL